MKIQWTYELQSPRAKRKCTAYLSGIKSRVEEHLEEYASVGDQEPYSVQNILSIGDGSRQINFTDRVKVPPKTPKTPLGSRRPQDTVASSLRDILLWGNEIPLEDPAALKRWDITCGEGDTKGVYVLTAIDTKASYYVAYRLTVDGTRGFNIVKIERMKSTSEKYWEENITLKQYLDGRWFPAERTRTEDMVQYKVSITDVTLNPKIPDDLFEFRFPKGTKVWDYTQEKWFIVGGNPDLPIADQSIGIAPSQSETKPKEDSTKTSKGSQPATQPASAPAAMPMMPMGGPAGVPPAASRPVLRSAQRIEREVTESDLRKAWTEMHDVNAQLVVTKADNTKRDALLAQQEVLRNKLESLSNAMERVENGSSTQPAAK